MPRNSRTRFARGVCSSLALAMGIACAVADSPPPTQRMNAPGRANPLAISLVKVAESALEAGDLNKAEQRFRRVLEIQPHSPVAMLGLARVARTRGDAAAERVWLGEILDRDPRSLDAWRRLAQLEVLANHPERARELVDRALEIDPNNSELLAMQFKLSGTGPPLLGLSDEKILELVQRHPFDLRLRLRAAQIRINAGEVEPARRLLRASYWMADLDPSAAREIAYVLSTIDPGFAAHKVVPVHVYADQTITRRPGWEMRLRILWRKMSAALDPLLATYFVPVSISPFDTTRATADLVSLEHAWSTSRKRWPEDGILVAFTERTRGRYQSQILGRAELLGRRTIVRLAPEATESRTLIHEVFHLYGGVHVVDVIDSLMNPSGDTTTIDPLNAEIIRLTRDRSFVSGGEAENINPYVDTGRLVDVYIQTLQVNLLLRAEGLQRASARGGPSRHGAAELARVAVRLDDHLAQVSEHVSQMLVRERLYAKAATYRDLAARLYGEQSKKGRQQLRKGERLRRLSEAIYSRQSPPPEPSPLPTETK